MVASALRCWKGEKGVDFTWRTGRKPLLRKETLGGERMELVELVGQSLCLESYHPSRPVRISKCIDASRIGLQYPDEVRYRTGD